MQRKFNALKRFKTLLYGANSLAQYVIPLKPLRGRYKAYFEVRELPFVFSLCVL